MVEAVLAPLAAWQNFYVIIGTAAAALTGLLFVVITLVSGALGRVSTPWSGIRVFSTPNVSHFSTALLIAALLSVPWPALWPAGLLVGLAGLLGVSYVFIVLWEIRHRLSYHLVLSDWLWYCLFPLIAYSALLVAGILLLFAAATALFVIAAGMLLLVIMGIRNAWDLVTYMLIDVPQSQNTSQD